MVMPARKSTRKPTSLQINWNVILLAIIAAVPPTLIAGAAFFQSVKTHNLVNSRMDEFKALVIKSSGDAAVLKEKATVADDKMKADAAIAADKDKAASPKK